MPEWLLQHRGYVHRFYGIAILVVVAWGIADYVKKRHQRS